MKKNAWIAGAAAVLIAGSAAWYFASPGYAMSELRDAASEGDADALEDNIDFPAVRESLKSQLKAEMMAQIASEETEGFGAFGGMMMLGMIDPMIDGMVTADGMARLIEEGRFAEPGTDAPVSEEEQVDDWTIERDGISSFTARPVAPAGEKVPGLVFERDGLGWRLTEIDIPEGGLGAS
ncbi:MAG: DUF2939 domain-containing protein [Alphaproteobacteria bacterium]|uniref:DUF2939 domain-containing protein n=1 Tax=viral metagenome TaxID=1070528 RepID=A0A6M3XIW8_9ZZZZ|nr:DUF2939 domain-containing protein [Alphaproteobacteria bacterium]MBU2342222.1 DUF2939 domain-containing protein [Alphaproteobacteria bacterium]